MTGKRVPEGPQKAVIVSSARVAAPCVDLTESSNESAYGPLVTGQTVQAAICGAGDKDVFELVAASGAVHVTFETGDTAISVTYRKNGTNPLTVDVPARGSRTIQASAQGLTTFRFEVQAVGAIGVEPFYAMTPQFTAQDGPRRRSVR